jgi:membrane protease YdiL (CAAX protease family)
MDPTLAIFILLFLAYLGGMIYLANLADGIPQPTTLYTPPPPYTMIVRWMCFGMIGMTFLWGIQVVMLGASPESFAQPGQPVPTVNITLIILALVLTLITTITTWILLTSPGVRLGLQQRLGGPQSSYNPESHVHRVALILMLCVTTIVFSQYVLAGGQEGLAQAIEDTGISLGELIFQAVIMIVFALLGVGYLLRRSLSQSLDRLGIRLPTIADFLSGTIAGIVLFVFSIIAQLIWSALTDPALLDQQSVASDQIFQQFSTLPLAFALAFTAAIGEETLFRGALQPVFGIILSSVFFALIHSQYILTPATLIIFVVSLGIGVLRRCQSTTAAMIAHFVYNFVPFIVVMLLPQLANLP